jgi:hypothetical protein
LPPPPLLQARLLRTRVQWPARGSATPTPIAAAAPPSSGRQRCGRARTRPSIQGPGAAVSTAGHGRLRPEALCGRCCYAGVRPEHGCGCCRRREYGRAGSSRWDFTARGALLCSLASPRSCSCPRSCPGRGSACARRERPFLCTPLGCRAHPLLQCLLARHPSSYCSCRRPYPMCNCLS